MLQIYKESAGSGKTYKLAYEYICLLLGHKNPETGIPELYRTGNNHRHILAITFTNKATDEMKRRIIHELALLAGMEAKWEGHKSSYLTDLTEYFHTTPERIASSAKEALFNLIFDFNYFHISTIDAFFQMVLRTFAREAELTGNYDIELDSMFAIKMGVDEMFNSLSRDPADHDSMVTADWISDYLLRNTAEGTFQNIFDKSNQFYNQVIQFINDISDEKFATNYSLIMEYLSDPSKMVRFKSGLYRISDGIKNKTFAKIKDFIVYLDSSGDVTGINRYVLPAIRKWYETQEIETLTPTVAKIAEEIENAYTAAGKKERNKTGGDPLFESLLMEAVKAAIKYKQEYVILRRTAQNLFILGLVDQVYRRISDYRAENNLILLSDTNSLLRRIIGDDEAPFVYERVGVWFRHFLIDEFQDTSGMQWDNLRPLLSESLSNEQENLIIGDEKQCIYRFRDSDPTLLGSKIQKQFAEYLPEDYDPSKGNTNWRSSADIVSFNNALFSTVARDCGFGEIYSNVCQKIAPKQVNHPGYILVKGLAENKDSKSKIRSSEEPITDGDASKEGLTSPEESGLGFSDIDERRLRFMADEIDRQLKSGYHGGEIAILTRRSVDAAKCIRYLEWRRENDKDFSRDFRIISDDAMKLNSSSAVRLIISILRLITENTSPTDSASHSKGRRPSETASMINRFEYFSATGLGPQEALAKAMAGDNIPVDLPFAFKLKLTKGSEPKDTPGAKEENRTGKIPEKESYNTVIGNSAVSSAGPSEQDGMDDKSENQIEDKTGDVSETDSFETSSHETDKTEPDDFSMTSLSSLVEKIIMEYLSEDRRRDENMYISALQDIIVDFSSLGANDVYSFIQWWDQHKGSINVSAPEDKEAIRIMTIHKSKGLEFKCVHIPFAQWPLTSDKSYEWFQPSGFEKYRSEIAPEDIPPILPFKTASYLEDTPYDSQLKELRREQLLDELNVMYVAFTRAIDELIILYKTPSASSLKDGKTTSVEYLLTRAITDREFLEGLEGRITLQEQDTLIIGHPTTARIEEKNPPTALDPVGVIEMVPYTSREHQELWADTRLEDLPELLEGAPRERGLILHDIMANISDENSLHPTVMKLTRKGLIPDGEAEAVETYLREAMATIADHGWYTGYRRVMTRRPLVSQKGYKTEADRIVWTADGHVDIIDYRFGEEDESHIAHMRILMAMMKAHTRQPIRGFLWYLDKNKLVTVAPQVPT